MSREQDPLIVRPQAGQRVIVEPAEISENIPVDARELLGRFVRGTVNVARRAIADPDADIEFFTTTTKPRTQLEPLFQDVSESAIIVGVCDVLSTDPNRTIRNNEEMLAVGRYYARNLKPQLSEQAA